LNFWKKNKKNSTFRLLTSTLCPLTSALLAAKKQKSLLFTKHYGIIPLNAGTPPAGEKNMTRKSQPNSKLKTKN
jgi:hypothetical protein